MRSLSVDVAVTDLGYLIGHLEQRKWCFATAIGGGVGVLFGICSRPTASLELAPVVPLGTFPFGIGISGTANQLYTRSMAEPTLQSAGAVDDRRTHSLGLPLSVMGATHREPRSVSGWLPHIARLAFTTLDAAGGNRSGGVVRGRVAATSLLAFIQPGSVVLSGSTSY